ncbi:type II toxin-antitoxin system Phd/YefM family antitoxin [Komarekiella sp. 'clone 1']|uniref:Antitoxin n=1 Tax=Komarekiella delphini-convector SJRDD-AB1 TaxID=2593771 RepID=A0AA40T314_9NOST|nr:type II toxin-antitoxin system prevent-host-death family antitoxin [Komarekiella delphini-convector]MBD6620003.1 type II toxin-antitoxin system Phd/YefM family antitoxin [Komarekiella delphini-convector SJRDD-AB1]
MEVRINLENIQTLTDFKRNAKDYVERIKLTKSPLVLTVNGKAEVVVQEAQAFQDMMDSLERLEEELKTLKLEMLRREIAIGIEQLDSGQYTEYDEESLPAFFEEIKTRGRKRLAENDAP